MGNQPSISNENTKESIKKDDVVLNQDEIFNKILEVSNNLLIEYNNEFLKEDFCNNIAIIYEKKLSNFNINILKNLYSNINSPTIDNEMLLTLQYIPKHDEEFITETFKDNLNEKFWNERINIVPEILLNDSKDIDITDIKSSIKYSPYYINSSHVNNLLQSINKINAEFKKQNGGSIDKVRIINAENKKGNIFLNQFNTNGNHEKNRLKNNYENNNNNKKNNIEINNNNNRNNIIPKQKIFKEKLSEQNEPQQNEMEQNEVEQNEIVQNIPKQNTKKQYPPKQNAPKQNAPKQNAPKQYPPKQNAPKQYPPKQYPSKQNAPKQNTLNENSSNKNGLNQNVSNENKTEELNKVTNKIIANTINIPSEENIDNKIIDNNIKYYVPKKYQSPTHFCKDVDKCKLSKKDLCTSITENFIVRNNIIAAILTTIPYKNSEGYYEGGICFQKFMNLKNCNVCVPYDYREFKNKDIKNILSRILEKADNLDESKCKENQGYFLKLTDAEIQILTNKISNISEEDINKYPKIKYNYYFIEFIKKLQNNYLENLNSLIIILDKIKESPILNNSTLNLISDETKKIIDNMYNTCHYYYIYGIISLISSDIKEDVMEKNSLSNVVSKALEKNSLA